MLELNKVNRLEIIDHRPCDGCRGTGRIENMNDSRRYLVCGKCGGGLVNGRTVLARGDIKIHLELQDNGETLKIFVDNE